MNMEEWNLRMRAQKEQERQKKTESAEILRGYRGGVKEDDMKLTTLRQEERRKQEEAERILHGYRETHVEERERRQRKDPDYPYPPIVAKHDDEIAFQEGSVAAKAAQFDSPQRDPTSGPSKYMNADVSKMELPNPPMAETDKDDSDYEFVHAAAPNYPGSEAPLTGSAQDAGISESKLLEEPALPIDPIDEDDVPDEEEKKAVDPDPALVSPSEPPLLHHPTVVRLDVNFSFGLITLATKPLLDSYMLAVDEVVRDTLESNAHLAHHITYNPKFGPFVQDCSDDGTLR